MDTIKIDTIDSVNLSQHIFVDLYMLSTFKSDEVGFDFMVKKSYIQVYINDLKDDGEENLRYSDIPKLEEIINNMKTEYLLIKN